MIHPLAHLQDEAKVDEAMLQAAHVVEATDEDAVGATAGVHLDGAFMDHPIEEGDDEL